MPCPRDTPDDAFVPIDAATLAFVEAVIAYVPTTLAPLRVQLAHARVHDDGNGWIDVRDAACGAPVDWPEGYPFDIVPVTHAVASRDPRGCYCIILWFHGDRRLDMFEFLNLEEDGEMDVVALAAWLVAALPPPNLVAAYDASSASRARVLRGRSPACD